MRADRSGSQIHDELMAYAFCMHNHLIYGGAIYCHSKTLEETNTLRRLIGLPFPEKSKKRKVNLWSKLYRERSSSFSKPSFLEGLVKRMGYVVPQTANEIFSPNVVASLRAKCSYPLKISKKKLIVLHIRRGDVSYSRYPKRFTSLELYLELIEHFKEAEFDPLILAHSESENLSQEEVAKLEKCGVMVLLDKTILQAWEDMITADVLVTAKSSFSYVPALYCKGTVFYQSFWHQKINGWLDANE